MEKELHKTAVNINYDGRKSVPKMNSDNVEVSEQTVFTYHQDGNLLWVEYIDGDILKVFLIGCVLDNGELDFVYDKRAISVRIRSSEE